MYRRAAATALGLLLATAVQADVTNGAAAGALSGSAAQAGGGNVSFGDSVVHGTDIPRQAPAFALGGVTTTLTETCAAGQEIAITTPFGGGGAGWMNELAECIWRLDAREARTAGNYELWKDLMCNKEHVRRAYWRLALAGATVQVPNPDARQTPNGDPIALGLDENGNPIFPPTTIPQAIEPCSEDRLIQAGHTEEEMTPPSLRGKAKQEEPGGTFESSSTDTTPDGADGPFADLPAYQRRQMEGS